MVQLLSVLVVSACSILLVSANRHTSPYPVYPLGLSYLKTYLERTINGIRVDIADCNLLSDAQLAERIRTLAPVTSGCRCAMSTGPTRSTGGVSCPSTGRWRTSYARQATPPIIGGAGFSIYPEAFMRELGADYGIHGEGEEPLAELIGALERGRTEIDIPSVYTRDGRRGSGRRSYLPSIEVQFEPELTGYYWKRSGMLNIQTKRGCPYDCIYCSYPSIDGRCVRTMDPEAIAENILRAKRDYGISYLFFTDSVFNIGPEYNVRLAETLIRRRTDIRWGAYFSPRGIDAEQMRLFRASGLTHIEFGTESFCDRTLEAYGKRFTFGDVERASRLALDEGVYYAHFLILGGYGDTRENVRETIENSRRMEYTVMFPYAGMRIYPHTRLAELAAKEGAIGRDDDLMAPSYYISRDFDLEEVRRAALATGKAWVFPTTRRARWRIRCG
ncbi:MAG: B12-binding domain-containing radical SAM protein [Alistipes onderdonkii]